MNALAIIASVMSAAAVLITAILGIPKWRQSRKDARVEWMMRMYDQMQEDVESLRTEVKLLRANHNALYNHAVDLHRHIEQELGPPAPPWPLGLA